MNESQIDCKILKTLNDHGTLRVVEIANEIDVHPITVDRACARLHDKEQIDPCGRGHYQITDHGRCLVDNQDDGGDDT